MTDQMTQAPLIAGESGGTVTGQWYEAIAVIGPVGALLDPVKNGDPFSNISNVVSAVTDVAAVLVDPIAALASSVASFCLDYMPPLPELLDILVGDPGALAAISDTWTNIGHRIDQVQADVVSAIRDGMPDWSGPAAEAYKGMAGHFAEAAAGAKSGCDALAVGFQIAGATITLVQGIIKSLISDLVGQLISAAVEIAATLGIGAPGVVGQVVTKIAKYAARAQEWVQQLDGAVKVFRELVDNGNTVFKQAVPGLQSVVRDFTTLSWSGLIDSGVDTYQQATS